MTAGQATDPAPIVEAERQEASSYLAPIAQRMRDRGLSHVNFEVPEGRAAAAIVERAREPRR